MNIANNENNAQENVQCFPNKINCLQESAYYITVTSQLIEDPHLADAEKMTFMMLSNFFRKDGYAICSDKWLAEKRNLSIKRIQAHLLSLEKKGYIWRVTTNEGLHKERKIWLSEAYAKHLLKSGIEDEDFKKSLRILENEYSVCSKTSSRIYKSINTKEKDDNIHIGESGCAKDSPPLPSSSEKEKLFETEHLNIFSKANPVFMDLKDEEIKAVIELYKEQETKIQNPPAWLNSCIKQKWYRRKLVSHRDQIELNKAQFKSYVSKNPHLKDEMEYYSYGLVHIPSQTDISWDISWNRFQDLMERCLKFRK